jgi:hypothetical protein
MSDEFHATFHLIKVSGADADQAEKIRALIAAMINVNFVAITRSGREDELSVARFISLYPRYKPSPSQGLST